MSAVLVFAATSTPQGRPVEIGARLYVGHEVVDQCGPTLVRLPAAYVQDVDRAMQKRIREVGRQLCTLWAYAGDMILTAAEVVVWDVEEFEATRALVHGILGRPGEPRRGITGKRIVGLRGAVAPLLRGDKAETWLPDFDDACALVRGGPLQPDGSQSLYPMTLGDVLRELHAIREALAERGGL